MKNIQKIKSLKRVIFIKKQFERIIINLGIKKYSTIDKIKENNMNESAKSKTSEIIDKSLQSELSCDVIYHF